MEDEMPREKLIANGSENLSDAELLALILKSGIKEKNVLDLSREILEDFSLNRTSRKTYTDFLKFKGISKAKACQIVAVFELARRFSNPITTKKITISSSKDICEIVKINYLNLSYEKVMLLMFDVKNNLLKKEILFEGSINFSMIEPRKIIKRVLEMDAYSFAISHNHPSGDSSPSEEDIAVTNKILRISKEIGIKFLDHIIVGDDYYSFFDNDLI